MKKYVAVFCLALFTVGAFLSDASAASEDVITANDIEEIMNTAKGFGSVTRDVDSDGDPALYGMVEGSRYGILFYGCKKNTDCEDIKFYSTWEILPTLEKINEWNGNNRFGKVYTNKNDTITIIMPVNLDGGVTRRNLEESFRMWTICLAGFKKDLIEQE